MRTLKTPLWSVLAGSAAILSLGLAAPVRADILFNNFGPGDSYNPFTGWTISEASNPNVGATFTQGEGFVALGAGNFTLDMITIALQHVDDGFGPNADTLTLYDDSGGLPGAVLESWSLSGLPNFGSGAAPTVVASAGGTVLTGGDLYWLIASAATGEWSAWNLNDQGDIGPHYFNGGAADNTRGAFRVEATAASVPEPTSLALLATGTIGLLAIRPRRKRA